MRISFRFLISIYQTKSRGSTSPAILSARDIHDLLWNHDNLLNRLSFERGLDFFTREGKFFDFGAGRVCRDFDKVAELAVNLDRKFEGALDQQGGVELRPG